MFTATQVQAIDPILQMGSQGEKVRELQALVNPRILVADQVKVDGIFGSKTEAAVKAFQKDRKLISDGVIGDRTWKALSNFATFLSVD